MVSYTFQLFTIQIFYFLVILTTAFALPFPEEHNDDDLQRYLNTRKEAMKNLKVFDGDMLGVEKMLEEDRNARRQKSYRWPNAVIPYYIDKDINSKKRRHLLAAFEYYQKHTCLKFVPRSSEKDYIWIFNGTACSSQVGRQDREDQPQAFTLTDGCEDVGTILHELGHAIGLFHEHSRYDRDQYVKIHLENVEEEEKYNFRIVPPSLAILYTPFDYDSIMIYDSKEFSKNGLDVIVPLKKGVVLLDAIYKEELTKSDLKRVHKMYKCNV